MGEQRANAGANANPGYYATRDSGSACDEMVSMGHKAQMVDGIPSTLPKTRDPNDVGLGWGTLDQGSPGEREGLSRKSHLGTPCVGFVSEPATGRYSIAHLCERPTKQPEAMANESKRRAAEVYTKVEGEEKVEVEWEGVGGGGHKLARDRFGSSAIVPIGGRSHRVVQS
ncbi:hypothetical protein BGZ61DRAFT_481556 [Ilyonectria robusta]|uniref:uncharacterized protein n=1 Tax=Ilyonectria robusta TaxID=1079257 RepID=UPI001E8D01BF|nr:uncharacterized protein BGZ61DRAFT_481556 [Ilyonectria robusta]KAH8676924.1 hypothetical protein BGZ61DRAFT_481556 [Ilyonectria robusta]